MAAVTAEIIVADLNIIKDQFITNIRRCTKADILSQFMDDEALSREARDLAFEAVEKMFKNVIWDDDVRGYEVSSTLEVVILRYRKNAEI